MKTILITQSNYIPWKGYFDSINLTDEFVLLDNVQYTKRDWRNRNLIKTKHGVRWLTIPVIVKNKFKQRINETEIADSNWGYNHWEIICQNYKNAKCFNEVKDVLGDLFLNQKNKYLSEINLQFILRVNEFLNIKTKIVKTEEQQPQIDKTNRLIEICKYQKADKYICGPASKNYINEQQFAENNIELEYLNYSDYPEYTQLYGKFVHEVSIIDLLFNEGSNASKYLKSFTNK
jgi:hypothetical protein